MTLPPLAHLGVWPWAGLGLLVIVLLARRLLTRRAGHVQLPYRRRETLFSAAEQAFLLALDSALDDRYRLFAKVRVADVLDVSPQPDRRAWWQAFTRISSKHFDYVVCERDGAAIRCAIELDDASHRRRDRQARDAFLDAACAAANLPLLRFDVQARYAVADVQARLREALVVKPATDSRPPREPVSAVPDCPRCAAPMRRRQARTGAHAGQWFWACSTYPACRGTRTLAS